MTLPAYDSSDPDTSLNCKESLLVVCGETSSDEHTAPVISYIKSRIPDIDVYGMGGESLQAAGMEITIDARESASVMGLTEVVHKISKLVRAFKTILREAEKRKTRTVLLVDFPDFNLRLARALKKRGLTVLYFISPQLWAWRQGRIEVIKKYVDAVFPIFPFEEEFYQGHGVDARFVGHPFMQRKVNTVDRAGFCRSFSIPEDKKLVALLPGSRKSEVSRLFPVFLEMIRMSGNDDHHYIVPVAGGVREMIHGYDVPAEVTLVPGNAREILSISDAAVVASGTATVEAALSGVPFCIVYKVSPLTYLTGKLLIRGVSFVGMPNLIYGDLLLRELIQGNCTPDAVKNELESLLYDEEYRSHISQGLNVIRSRLEKDSDTPFFEIVGSAILGALQKA
jgi:lipid-A-disaccharide synthase